MCFNCQKYTCTSNSSGGLDDKEMGLSRPSIAAQLPLFSTFPRCSLVMCWSHDKVMVTARISTSSFFVRMCMCVHGKLPHLSYHGCGIVGLPPSSFSKSLLHLCRHRSMNILVQSSVTRDPRVC